MLLEPRTRARIANWVGFTLFVGFAASALLQAPEVRVLLLPTIIYELIIAIAFLRREPAHAARRDLRARLVAHGATFFVVVAFPVARGVNPAWFTPTTIPAVLLTGWTVWLAGSVLMAWSVWHLRGSFSIEPQARRLVTSGPYRFARHPIYAGYLLQCLGMWMRLPTLPFGLLLLVWGALVRQRMRYEEQVLGEAFPEYAEYRKRVGLLGPIGLRVPNVRRLAGGVTPDRGSSATSSSGHHVA